MGVLIDFTFGRVCLRTAACQTFFDSSHPYYPALKKFSIHKTTRVIDLHYSAPMTGCQEDSGYGVVTPPKSSIVSVVTRNVAAILTCVT